MKNIINAEYNKEKEKEKIKSNILEYLKNYDENHNEALSLDDFDDFMIEQGFKGIREEYNIFGLQFILESGRCAFYHMDIPHFIPEIKFLWLIDKELDEDDDNNDLILITDINFD